MPSVSRWVTNDAKTQAVYNALVAKVCPCVTMVHSQGGNFGFNAALAAHDKVKALIAVEPSGAPPEMANLGGGEGRAAAHRVGRLHRREKSLAALGSKVDWLSLPHKGIKGNGHMLRWTQIPTTWPSSSSNG
jgi:pimeloyl-ACP methyl ester carboxylesterase